MKAFDKDEKELMESLENEDWVSVGDIEAEIAKAREAAEVTVTKNERMNIRISPRDLKRLKVRALEEGIPYQTVVSSILHKYRIGRLQEIRE